MLSEMGGIMKLTKIAALCLAALMLVSLFGCRGGKKKNNENDSDTQVLDSASDTDSQGDSDNKSDEVPTVPVELYKLEIVSESYNTETYSGKLKYPVVSGYSSSEIQEKVNALIRSYSKAKMDYAIAQTGAYSFVDYTVESFDITFKNEKFFSAVSRVSIMIEGESDEIKLAYGINVDLKNSRTVELGSFIKFNEFKIDFGNGHFGQTYGYEKLLEKTTFDDIINPYSELYSIYPEYYIRQNGDNAALAIIADTIPVHGYYAIFECDVTDTSFVDENFFELVDGN